MPLHQRLRVVRHESIQPRELRRHATRVANRLHLCEVIEGVAVEARRVALVVRHQPRVVLARVALAPRPVRHELRLHELLVVSAVRSRRARAARRDIAPRGEMIEGARRGTARGEPRARRSRGEERERRGEEAKAEATRCAARAGRRRSGAQRSEGEDGEDEQRDEDSPRAARRAARPAARRALRRERTRRQRPQRARVRSRACGASPPLRHGELAPVGGVERSRRSLQLGLELARRALQRGVRRSKRRGAPVVGRVEAKPVEGGAT